MGFIIICFLQVLIDMILLLPLNWYFNKFTKNKNIIINILSFPLLIVHVEYFYLIKKVNMDIFDLVFISSSLSFIIFLILKRLEFKKISTWILALINLICSFGLFTFINTTQILLIALLAKWFYELKNYAFR